MSGKTVSLTGEVHISTGSIYTTVDAQAALKCIGMVYGLYDHSEDLRDSRVMLEKDGDRPALVVQEDISRHGSPCWETVRTITDDPEKIRRYMAFREIVGIVRQMEIEQERLPAPQEKPVQPKKKGGRMYER